MTPEQQQPLEGMEAVSVRFVGMAADSLDQLPELEEVMTFLVRAVCTGRGLELRKDGEKRRTARMEVIKLEPQGAPVKPDPKPATPPLFAVPGDAVDHRDGAVDLDAVVDDEPDDQGDGEDD